MVCILNHDDLFRYRPQNLIKTGDRGYDPLPTKSKMRMHAFHGRNRVFPTKLSYETSDGGRHSLKERRKTKFTFTKTMHMKWINPDKKVTGSGSGTAGDTPPKAAPLIKYLANNDSAVRVLNAPNTLANYAQQLPPKAADEPLSFCTHKEKGRNDPQARSERQPTGARAYQPKDSAVRVQIPPS